MNTNRALGLATILVVALAARSQAAGRVFEVEYPPSTAPGALAFGVTYRLWVPDDVKTLRGIIVHQHGCGGGACKAGATAADDLHWQALAAKWDCALLGPSYHQEDGQNCRLWCDPRNGSRTAFLKGLDDLAAKSGHPEVARVPWCLWGHSGGGFWASLMQASDPERIIAIWCRSGTALLAWEKGEITKPELTAAAYGIPVMCNPGVKENADSRFNGAWTGALTMFQRYRAKGAPIGFAPDPRTAHECGDSRYLAIPFFDACLALRLPDRGGADSKLKPIETSAGWLAKPLGETAVPAARFEGKPEEAVWLPNEQVARAWTEYVKTGAVGDSTPPPPPKKVRLDSKTAAITWDAAADFESGLRGFVILRDGKEIAQVPEKPIGKFGRPLFQSMSYHDTPERPLPALRFIDTTAGAKDAAQRYAVISVNGVGLRSQPKSATP